MGGPGQRLTAGGGNRCQRCAHITRQRRGGRRSTHQERAAPASGAQAADQGGVGLIGGDISRRGHPQLLGGSHQSGGLGGQAGGQGRTRSGQPRRSAQRSWIGTQRRVDGIGARHRGERLGETLGGGDQTRRVDLHNPLTIRSAESAPQLSPAQWASPRPPRRSPTVRPALGAVPTGPRNRRRRRRP